MTNASRLINTKSPEQIRTLMVISQGQAAVTRLLNKEIIECYGERVFNGINEGSRMIWHGRYDKNIVIFDIELAAIEANAPLFDHVKELVH